MPACGRRGLPLIMRRAPKPWPAPSPATGRTNGPLQNRSAVTVAYTARSARRLGHGPPLRLRVEVDHGAADSVRRCTENSRARRPASVPAARASAPGAVDPPDLPRHRAAGSPRGPHPTTAAWSVAEREEVERAAAEARRPPPGRRLAPPSRHKHDVALPGHGRREAHLEGERRAQHEEPGERRRRKPAHGRAAS